MRSKAELERELEQRLAQMGYELVMLQWAGSGRRPILRVRVDRAALDRPVSVGDCAVVSRGLEAWLDGDSRVPDRYVLEVSSPGIERPLVRSRDFERFRGSRVLVKGKTELCGRGTRLEGELLGLVDDDDGAGSILLRLNGGDEVEIPRAEVERARLVHDWKA